MLTIFGMRQKQTGRIDKEKKKEKATNGASMALSSEPKAQHQSQIKYKDIEIADFLDEMTTALAVDKKQVIDLFKKHAYRLSKKTKESPEALIIRKKEARSKRVGANYLFWRMMEYNAKIIGSCLIVYSHDPAKGLAIADKVMTGLGSVFGNIGNVLQGTQGVLDTFMTLQHLKTFRCQTKGVYGALAILRGTFNIVADTAAVIALGADKPAVHAVALSAGMFTDMLGLFKNMMDTSGTNGLKSMAYGFCTWSRFPFILSSLMKILIEFEYIDEEDWIQVAITLGLIAMVLFNTGALIRESLYLKETRRCCFPFCPQPKIEEIDSDDDYWNDYYSSSMESDDEYNSESDDDDDSLSEWASDASADIEAQVSAMQEKGDSDSKTAQSLAFAKGTLPRSSNGSPSQDIELESMPKMRTKLCT